MGDDPRILQQGIEPLAFQGNREQPDERVGCEDDEQQEEDADQSLNAENTGAQGLRHVPPEVGDGGPKDGQDQHPQQHRAFMVPPSRCDLVEERFGCMRIGGNNHHGEIRGCKQPDQNSERQSDKQELSERC